MLCLPGIITPMASTNSQSQQNETQLQNVVGFSTAHFLSLKKVKRVGKYTIKDITSPAEELGNVIGWMRYIFDPRELLVDRQEVIFRINDEETARRLTTEKRLFTGFEKSERSESNTTLYPADYVRFLLGLLHTLKEIAQQAHLSVPELAQFVENYDETFFRYQAHGDYVKDENNLNQKPYFAITEEELLTQENLHKIEQLLELLEDSYQKIKLDIFNIPEEIRKQIEDEESTREKGGKTSAQNIVEAVQRIAEEKKAAEEEAINQQSTQSLAVNQVTQLQISITGIREMAFQTLVTDFFEEAGFDLENLPPELSLRFEELRRILNTEINAIIEKLPLEEQEKLLHAEMSERMAVLRLLLIKLYSNPENQFFITLQDIYQKSVEVLIKENKFEEAKRVIEKADQVFAAVSNDATPEQSEDLEKIRLQVKAWMAEYIRQIEAQRVQEAPVVADLIFPTPKLKFKFSSIQSTQLEEKLSNTNLPIVEQRQIQQQVANLVWASLAQHFDNPDQVPPHIMELVSARAIEYVSSLDQAELTIMAKRITRLSHHIGIFSNVKIFEIPEFVEYKNTYDNNRTALQVDRNELIKEETEVATQTIIETVFSKNNITDNSVPDENGLQKEFDDLKQYIEQEVYSKIFDLSTKQLLELKANPAVWDEFFKDIEKELSNDPQFRSFVKKFFEQYITYLVNQNRQAEANQLQTTTKDFRTDEGVLPGLSTEQTHKKIEFGKEETVAVEPTISRAPVTQRAQSQPEETSEAPDGFIETTPLTIRKKKNILNTLLQNKWDTIADEDKIVLYKHFGYPIPKNLDSPTADLKLIKDYCSRVPDKFLDFDIESLPIIKKMYEESKSKKGLKAQVVTFEELNEIKKTPVEDTKKVQQIASGNEQLGIAIKQYLIQEHQAVIVSMLVEQQKLDSQFVQQLIKNYNVQIAQAATINQQIQMLAANDAFNNDIKTMLIASALTNVSRMEAAYVPQQNRGFTQLISRGRINPFTQLKTFLNNKISPQQAIKDTGKRVISNRLLTAVGGLVTAGVIGYKLFQDEKTRNAVITGITAGASAVLYGLSTIPGIAAFAMGNIFFFPFLGPLAVIPATILADIVSSLLPWGKIPGLDNVRLPPGPWNSLGIGEGADRSPGLRDLRGNLKNGPQTNSNLSAGKGQNGSISNATNTATATTASPTANAANQASQLLNSGGSNISSTISQTASSVASNSVSFFGFGFGAFVPLLSLSTVFIVTITVVTVIMSAFIVPVPTHPNPSNPNAGNPTGTQPTEKYLKVTKVPTDKSGKQLGKIKEEVKNHTATDITYTITVTPKPGYAIKVTGVKDLFSGTTTLQSKLALSTFPSEPITESNPFTTTYTINTGTAFEDTFLTNTVTLTFDVLDQTGYTIERTQTYYASASVYIGTPKVGCWPTNGVITTTPFATWSATHINNDAFDIGGSVGNPIHAPFPGNLCWNGYDTTGYGNLLKLTFEYNGGGASIPLTLYFGHLSQVASEFSAHGCYPVEAGHIIGYMGSTGNSTGPHLHYELQSNYMHKLHDAPSLSDLIIGGRNTQLKDSVSWQCGTNSK